MRILIDADGCPVVNETIEVAKKFELEVILFCDTAHVFNREDVLVCVLPKGRDAVDFALVGKVQRGDCVVTQDYGLAAMVLAKSGYAINQNGMVYNKDNIDQLLFFRAASQKARAAKIRMKGPTKRTKKDNDLFKQAFHTLCEQILKDA